MAASNSASFRKLPTDGKDEEGIVLNQLYLAIFREAEISTLAPNAELYSSHIWQLDHEATLNPQNRQVMPSSSFFALAS